MKVRYAVVLALTACAHPDADGQLEATWTGADTGRLVAPAIAEWCSNGRYVSIRAMRGDTGLAVAILPADSTQFGQYQVIDTLTTAARPAAALALRWLKEMAVRGFQSDQGTVVLRREPDGKLSGTLTASGRVLGDSRSRLDINGNFRGVVLRPAPKPCPTLLEPDTSVNSPDGDHVLSQGLRP